MYRTKIFLSFLRSHSKEFSANKTVKRNNFPQLKMQEANETHLPELEEPRRPPYSCGKFQRAEKAMNYLNRARTSLDSILKLFEEFEDEHDQIPILLETFKDITEKKPNMQNERNHPFIVFEGLDGSGKSSICRRFAEKVGAEVMPTPPKSLSAFREKFDGTCWHAPFYYFGNYVASVEVAETLKHKPVVMDRFWHSTTSFALAQMKDDYFDVMKSTELPEKGSKVYEWPNDLLKPDIVIFLDVSEETRIQRLSRRKVKTEQEELLESKREFRKNVLLAYENMENPGICKVNGNGTFNEVLQGVAEKVKFLF